MQLQNNTSKKKKVFSLITIFIFLLASILIIFQIKRNLDFRQRAATGDSVTFALTPETPPAGQTTFDTALTLNANGNDISGVDILITSSDPSVLKITGFTPATTPNYDQALNAVDANGSSVHYVAVNKTADPIIGAPTIQLGTLRVQQVGTATNASIAIATASTVIGRSVSTGLLFNAGSALFTYTVSPSTNTPTPSPTGSTGSPTNTPVPSSSTPTPTFGFSSSPTTSVQPPSCISLNLDRATIGVAPYVVIFTINGTTPNASITKVTMNFGDGPTQDITQAGGIGTKTVGVSIAHTYNNPNTYTASVTITDNTGAVSMASAACSKTITVTQAVSQQGATGGSSTRVATGNSAIAPTSAISTTGSSAQQATQPQSGNATQQSLTTSYKNKESIQSPGPGNGAVIVCIVGTVITVIGGFLFFLL